MKDKTTRDFERAVPIWPSVEHWAGEMSYRLVANDGTTRTYYRNPLYAPATTVRLTQTGTQVHLEAWYQRAIMRRLFYGGPPTRAVESEGLQAILPKAIARREVNRLLRLLEQPPIS